MKKYLNKTLIVCILFLVVIVFLASKLYANSGSLGGSYFGGKVISKVPCTCNTDGGFQITLSGSLSSAGTYLENNQTKKYGRFMISVSNNLLGKTIIGGVCMVGAQPYCTPLPITKGTINYTGIGGF